MQLIAGLAVCGAGQALMAQSQLGNGPWVVLSEGVSSNTTLSVGGATIAISFVVLLLWWPLGQRPGIGTVLNALLIGFFFGLASACVAVPSAISERYALLLLGIALIGIGAALYLATDLGPGPRDGLMTGLHVRTGRSIRLTRTALELGALVAGYALGGRAGVGTVLFAVLIGPTLQAGLKVLGWSPGDRAEATKVGSP